jgi:hypothetical protein
MFISRHGLITYWKQIELGLWMWPVPWTQLVRFMVAGVPVADRRLGENHYDFRQKAQRLSTIVRGSDIP